MLSMLSMLSRYDNKQACVIRLTEQSGLGFFLGEGVGERRTLFSEPKYPKYKICARNWQGMYWNVIVVMAPDGASGMCNHHPNELRMIPAIFENAPSCPNENSQTPQAVSEGLDKMKMIDPNH